MFDAFPFRGYVKHVHSPRSRDCICLSKHQLFVSPYRRQTLSPGPVRKKANLVAEQKMALVDVIRKFAGSLRRRLLIRSEEGPEEADENRQ